MWFCSIVSQSNIYISSFFTIFSLRLKVWSFQRLKSRRMRCIHIYVTFISETIDYCGVSKKFYYNKWVSRFQNDVFFKKTYFLNFFIKIYFDCYDPFHTVQYPHVRALIKNSVITNSVSTKSRLYAPCEFVITRFYCRYYFFPDGYHYKGLQS